MRHKIFIILIALVFLGITLVLDFMPRPAYSELERRELSEFPEFSLDKLYSGEWTRQVSAWFSDTEPYRDELLTLSHTIMKYMAVQMPSGTGDEAVTFHATNDAPSAEADELPESASNVEGYESHIEENAKMANSGILVVGEAPNARALMVYGGSGKMGVEFANAANKYHEALGPGVRVYCMPIPNSGEFYTPDKAKSVMKPQIATINNIFAHLAPGVIGVDCYTPLSQHTDEPIYMRTDHHWAPRGAYYAAQAFAKAAGVPFKDLSTYTEHVIHNFVGTMYGYSKDIAIKQSPEDFVYYTPNGVDYTTTYINYNVDRSLGIRSVAKPVNGQFFMHYKDGSGAAYSTFMGGDTKITQVRTSIKNGRRLLILKDSFGNALPGYLFHSFEEIHVIDCRYFIDNIKRYVTDNKITDVLFANNTFKCCGNSTASNYMRFLTQSGGIPAQPETPTSDKADPGEPQTKADENKNADQSVNPVSKGDDSPAEPKAEEPARTAAPATVKAEEPATPKTETPAVAPEPTNVTSNDE